jgi:SPP1 gp7 family putative phage head morphogenesis protein
MLSIVKNIRRIDRDPTRTIGLRRRYSAEMYKRFMAIKKAVRKKIIEENYLGWESSRQNIIRLAGYEYTNVDSKINGFMRWLNNQEDIEIFDTINTPIGTEPWQNVYVRHSYQAGMEHARQDLIASGADIPSFQSGLSGISATFNTPFHAERVAALYTRNYTDLRGVTNAMDAQMSRVLADGMAKGENPITIARNLNDRVSKIGITRAKLIARTEVVRAHNIGALAEYQSAEGIIGESIYVQWWTALDERVRSSHAARHGRVYTRELANGLIGEPNCRCSLLPWIESIHGTGEEDMSEVNARGMNPKVPKGIDVDDDGNYIFKEKKIPANPTDKPSLKNKKLVNAYAVVDRSEAASAFSSGRLKGQRLYSSKQAAARAMGKDHIAVHLKIPRNDNFIKWMRPVDGATWSESYLKAGAFEFNSELSLTHSRGVFSFKPSGKTWTAKIPKSGGITRPTRTVKPKAVKKPKKKPVVTRITRPKPPKEVKYGKKIKTYNEQKMVYFRDEAPLEEIENALLDLGADIRWTNLQTGLFRTEKQKRSIALRVLNRLNRIHIDNPALRGPVAKYVKKNGPVHLDIKPGHKGKGWTFSYSNGPGSKSFAAGLHYKSDSYTLSLTGRSKKVIRTDIEISGDLPKSKKALSIEEINGTESYKAKIGAWGVSDDFDATLTHEYGHFVDRTALATGKRIEQEANWVYGFNRKYNEIANVAIQNLKDFPTNTAAEQYYFKKVLSAYSGTNRKEFFAELFCHVNGQSKKDIIFGETNLSEMMRDVLGRKAAKKSKK